MGTINESEVIPVERGRTRSEQEFEKALRLMPGGVNSPVRAFRAVGGSPLFVERGEGSRLYDIDGNAYIDYCLSWGPLILGHAHPAVTAAVMDAARQGTSFGAPTEWENRMAELLVSVLPSVEMVRMVNSGTEATMSVLRLARAFTGRSKIVKFEGCYHGHADSFLIRAGSGVATLGLPDSPGVPESVAAETLTAPFNDTESVRVLFEQFGDAIAAVFVEPVPGNMGLVLPQPGFLQELRRITREYGALLVFDEVMTGFRVSYSGAQGRFAIDPDLTTLGKVIGGGLPVGAYGGRRDIMEKVAPSGPVYQAGTLSGNPLAMAAGYATLQAIGGEPAYTQLESRGKKLADGFQANAREKGIPLYTVAIGGMFGMFFCEEPVIDYQSAKAADSARFARFHQEMLKRGVYVPPSQMEAWFLSLAHSDEDIARTLEAHRQALAAL